MYKHKPDLVRSSCTNELFCLPIAILLLFVVFVIVFNGWYESVAPLLTLLLLGVCGVCLKFAVKYGLWCVSA